MTEIIISKSNKKDKKFDARIDGKKTISFGAVGYELFCNLPISRKCLERSYHMPLTAILLFQRHTCNFPNSLKMRHNLHFQQRTCSLEFLQTLSTDKPPSQNGRQHGSSHCTDCHNFLAIVPNLRCHERQTTESKMKSRCPFLSLLVLR